MIHFTEVILFKVRSKAKVYGELNMNMKHITVNFMLTNFMGKTAFIITNRHKPSTKENIELASVKDKVS